MVHLSPRLAAVAALVAPGARAVDVGTDHGMIPVWLVQAGICEHVLATDIRPGPLAAAAELIARTGTGGHIDTMLTDGLQGVEPGLWDTVIIAGMGGETIAAILAGAPWTREARLILEPQSKRAHLRRFLCASGYRIGTERLTEDAGRIYPVLTATGGEPDTYTPAELCLGKWEAIGGDPLLAPYMDRLMARTEKAAPYDGEAAALLEELRNLRGRLDT